MSATAAIASETAAQLARCLDCGCGLAGREACPSCGRSYPETDGILAAIGPLTGTNRIAAAFYDGPSWPRFRPWERLFLFFQGGQRGARRQILRHLPKLREARVLEVGIGDGENQPLLPSSWTLHGVDIARIQLAACRDRFPEMAGRLVWAEAEALPFADGTFDAVYTIGGFNYFRDHAAALREMRRVARPGMPVIVADEIPTLFRLAPGHFFGFDALEHWSLQAMGLDREFIAMVLGHRIDIDALARREWPGHRRFPIWNRLGYCLVDPGPRAARSEGNL
ncbi:MAG TPA: class I SAM-dependent methyltransferase [Isosphaeraceae bacterium]|jgi:SAM-dependent methyltransferase|nr:class I SAM-dependent methyltransferase [Isosphaeraceae bacterium]